MGQFLWPDGNSYYTAVRANKTHEGASLMKRKLPRKRIVKREQNLWHRLVKQFKETVTPIRRVSDDDRRRIQ